MKKIPFSFFILLLFACIQYGIFPFFSSASPSLRIIAHRGDSSCAPENSLPAIESALQNGTTCIELDIRTTCEGIPVLFHDKNTLRMTGVDRTVSEMNYHDFLMLPLDTNYPSTTPCSLEDVLLLYATCSDVCFHFDLKVSGAEEKVVSLLKKYDSACCYEISSSDLSVLSKIKKLSPDTKVFLQISNRKDIYNYLFTSPDYLDGISVKSSYITAFLISVAQRRGHNIYAWTINDRFHLWRLLHLGIDGIITDNPSLLRKMLS